MSGVRHDPDRTRIFDWLEHYAIDSAGKAAVIFDADEYSFGELKTMVDRCAAALLAAGVKKGQRVAMLCTPRTEFWVVFLAVSKLGAIWVGLNPKYRRHEMQHVVSDSDPSLLFVLSESEGRHYEEDVCALEFGSALVPIVTIDGKFDGGIDYSDFLSAAGDDEFARLESFCEAVEPNDPAIIVYTSGSSGRPKGALLSHHSITGGALVQRKHLAVENPSLVVSFPINHVACVADACGSTFVRGGTIVFQEQFEPAETLRAIQDYRCTILGGVPTMLMMLLDHPDMEKADLSSLELIAWGGAAMPVSFIGKLREVCPRLLTMYGMTETAAHVTHVEEGASIDILANTIGKPDISCECRIVDSNGQVCGPLTPGELQLRADYFMLGYWRNQAATEAALTTDGWLKTGDLAEWQEDGNLRLVGRMSEMFKSGGYNVYPREIEEVLEALPSVAMAAVIGVDDELYQQVGYAFVIPAGPETPSDEFLRKSCREKLANYKVPKQFYVSEDLPVLPIGKIDKRALRDRLSQS